MTGDQFVKMIEDNSSNHEKNFDCIEYKDKLFYNKYKYCVYFDASEMCLIYLRKSNKQSLLTSSYYKLHIRRESYKNALLNAVNIFEVFDKYAGMMLKRVYHGKIAIYTNNLEIYKDIIDSTGLNLSAKKPAIILNCVGIGKIYRKRSNFSYRVVLKNKTYQHHELQKLLEFCNKNEDKVKFSPSLSYRIHYCLKEPNKNVHKRVYLYGSFVDLKSEKLLSILCLMCGDIIEKKFEIVTSREVANT
jgi:hypothetical protein